MNNHKYDLKAALAVAKIDYDKSIDDCLSDYYKTTNSSRNYNKAWAAAKLVFETAKVIYENAIKDAHRNYTK